MIMRNKLYILLTLSILNVDAAIAQTVDLSDLLDQTQSDFDRGVERGAQLERDAALRAASRRNNSNVRCISATGGCTSGFGCIIDEIFVSGGPGQIENDGGSSSTICTGYNGIAGTYGYSISIGDKVCSGSFPVTSGVQSSVTINVYSDTCKISSISEF